MVPPHDGMPGTGTRWRRPGTPSQRESVQIVLAVLGLWLARQRGDPPAVKEHVQRQLAAAEDPDATRLGICEDLSAKALISLGLAGAWTARPTARTRAWVKASPWLAGSGGPTSRSPALRTVR
jgi:hypothetical protein